MPIKKIFLASSEELKNDRLAFELMIARLNQQWRARDYTFDVVVWENFIDAMSREGLQKEYNRAASACDLFVMLFFTKVGRYTLEEFETVFSALQAGTGPRIYTYFRDDFVRTGDIDDGVKSLLDFKARMQELKHYVTPYRNTEDLQFQFSLQLEKLYGDEGAAAQEIGANTPPVKVGELALVLSYRQLYGGGTVDPARLAAAVELSSRPVRDAVFNMAMQMRREHWLNDKRQMERSIPVFEAITRADPHWHAPFGQLGYALVDKLAPEWARAKKALDRAVELRGDRVGEGYYYQFNRARCAVALDPAFAQRHEADAATKEAVLEVLRQARRENEADWERLYAAPDTEPIRDWLKLNGSPRLR
jgi:hypothetical protein